jgi:hypothetical protein
MYTLRLYDKAVFVIVVKPFITNERSWVPQVDVGWRKDYTKIYDEVLFVTV